MKLFKIWLIGFLAVYFIPSGMGAFIALDWSNFDFTTWKTYSRTMMFIMEIGWTGIFLMLKEAGALY